MISTKSLLGVSVQEKKIVIVVWTKGTMNIQTRYIIRNVISCTISGSVIHVSRLVYTCRSLSTSHAETMVDSFYSTTTRLIRLDKRLIGKRFRIHTHQLLGKTQIMSTKTVFSEAYKRRRAKLVCSTLV